MQHIGACRVLPIIPSEFQLCPGSYIYPCISCVILPSFSPFPPMLSFSPGLFLAHLLPLSLASCHRHHCSLTFIVVVLWPSLSPSSYGVLSSRGMSPSLSGYRLTHITYLVTLPGYRTRFRYVIYITLSLLWTHIFHITSWSSTLSV